MTPGPPWRVVSAQAAAKGGAGLCRYSHWLGAMVIDPDSLRPAKEGATVNAPPAPAAPALNPLPPTEHPAGADMAGRKVLVVDDDIRSLFAVSALLKRVDVEVLSAERGQRGIDLLQHTPDIDLALVDIMMPGMDGYATMRTMRRLPAGDVVPLIAYTARVDRGERERCLQAGASDYISKPVDTAQLLHVLGEWLPAGVPGAHTPGYPALMPLSPPEHLAGTALAGMTAMVVDDDSRSIFAVSALLKRLNVRVLSAEGGEQGIELLEHTPDVDLVLVDIMMPGMDGYTTMRAMRKLPAGDHVPLVACTAKAHASERQRCIAAGASAYVPKPIDTAQFRSVLGDWLPLDSPA
jgi:CheY-like chemotaxis protein